MLVSTAEKQRIARLAYQAIQDARIVNADVLSLTTVAGLANAVAAQATSNDFYLNEARKRCKLAIEQAGHADIAILTNTNVAAADTVAGLYSLLTAVDPAASAYSNKHSRDRVYQ